MPWIDRIATQAAWFYFFLPVGAAEHRSPFAEKRAFCLSRSEFWNGELGERAKGRGAQGTREAGKPSGCLFFWLLFFGQAKKSNPPGRGGKKAQEKNQEFKSPGFRLSPE